MTGDEFRARYALLEQIADGGVRSFHAVTPTGGVVMVHFIDGGITPGNLALLSSLERLEPERRARVREVTAVDGSVAVVTDLLPDFRSLPAWLGGAPSESSTPSAAPGPDDSVAAMTATASPAPSPSPVAPSAPADAAPPAARIERADEAVVAKSASPPAEERNAQEPGEFTRLFMAADLRGAPAFSQPPAAPESAPPPPLPEPGPAVAAESAATESAAAEEEPGAFTRLFRAPMGPSAPAPPPAAPPPVSPPSAEPAGISAAPPAVPPPAERAPEPPTVREPSPFSGAAPGPGAGRGAEESALFQALAASPAPPEPGPAPSPEPPASVPTPESSGGTTGVFPAPVEAPPSPSSPSGGATGVFSAPGPPSAGSEAGPSDRSEFSQLFKRLDLPDWALSSGGRPAAPEPPRFEREAGPSPAADDEDYLERLYSTPAPAMQGDAARPTQAPDAPLAPLPSAFASAAASPFPSAAPPPPSPAPAPPAPAPSAVPPRSTTPLLAGLIITVVLTLALLLYFALR